MVYVKKDENREKRKEHFIAKARGVHNDRYDYSDIDYVNDKTKICIGCREHGKFWQTPHAHLGGQGCPICGLERVKKMHRKSKESFIQQVKDMYGDKYDLSDCEYVNNKTKVKVKCNDCGETFEIKPNDLLGGHGCRNCSIKNRTNYYTFDDILGKIKDKPNRSLVSDSNDKKKLYRLSDYLEMICPIHGIYKHKVNFVLEGKTCPMCGKLVGTLKNADKVRLSKEEVVERVSQLSNGEIEIDISTYVKTMEPARFIHKNCGRDFMRTFNAFMNFPTCPHCVKERISKERTKTTEQFIEEARIIHGDYYIFDHTIYTKSSEYVTITCPVHGDFIIEANSFLQGRGCPYHHVNKSIMEEEMYDYVHSLVGDEVKLTNNYRITYDGKRYETDIYIPDLKMGFEFDGLYWHNELNKPNDYHLAKTNAFKEKGIQIYHIFEDEWNRKRDIVESFISNCINKPSYTISSSDCNIAPISDSESNEFFDKNHIKGGCEATNNYGLYYNEDLVYAVSFKQSNETNEYELVRYGNKNFTCVTDGINTIFNYFVETINPNKVFTFSDLRFYKEGLFENLGFLQIKKIDPNYYYVIFDKKYEHTSFEKEKLEEMKRDNIEVPFEEYRMTKKWYKIYDCGSLYYEWNNK